MSMEDFSTKEERCDAAGGKEKGLQCQYIGGLDEIAVRKKKKLETMFQAFVWLK